MVRDSAETEAALEQANAQQGDRPNPLHTAFVAHGKTTLLVAGVASFWPTVFYVSFVWIATFETTLVEPPLSSAFTINTVMVVLSTVLFPVLGVVADRVGPSRFMRAGTALAVVAALPAFAMVDRGDVFGMIVGQFVLMLVSCAFGPGLPAWMVDAAPVECRTPSWALATTSRRRCSAAPRRCWRRPPTASAAPRFGPASTLRAWRRSPESASASTPATNVRAGTSCRRAAPTTARSPRGRKLAAALGCCKTF